MLFEDLGEGQIVHVDERLKGLQLHLRFLHLANQLVDARGRPAQAHPRHVALVELIQLRNRKRKQRGCSGRHKQEQQERTGPRRPAGRSAPTPRGPCRAYQLRHRNREDAVGNRNTNNRRERGCGSRRIHQGYFRDVFLTGISALGSRAV